MCTICIHGDIYMVTIYPDIIRIYWRNILVAFLSNRTHATEIPTLFDLQVRRKHRQSN